MRSIRRRQLLHQRGRFHVVIGESGMAVRNRSGRRSAVERQKTARQMPTAITGRSIMLLHVGSARQVRPAIGDRKARVVADGIDIAKIVIAFEIAEHLAIGGSRETVGMGKMMISRTGGSSNNMSKRSFDFKISSRTARQQAKTANRLTAALGPAPRRAMAAEPIQ